MLSSLYIYTETLLNMFITVNEIKLSHQVLHSFLSLSHLLESSSRRYFLTMQFCYGIRANSLSFFEFHLEASMASEISLTQSKSSAYAIAAIDDPLPSSPYYLHDLTTQA